MRLALLAGILFAATACLAQTIAPGLPNAAPQPWTPPSFAPPARDFTKLPPDWGLNAPFPGAQLTLPKIATLGARPGTELDPKILVHPPQAALGEQPPGTLIAQNLYPGLEFKRIREPQAGGRPIPTDWPKLRIENIPTIWPNLTVHPAGPASPASAAKK